MTSKPDIPTVFRFFTEVGIIDQLISTRMEALLPGRMTYTQFGILNHLARRPDGGTPLQIAQAFQVPKTSMTHMLAGLTRAGFVRADPHPTDRRSKVMRMTEDGHRVLMESAQTVGASLAPVLRDLGMQDFAAALPHLERIRMALDAARDTPSVDGGDGGD